MAKIGKNVIENLTSGMYENTQIIYREYIQNAADSIDKAQSQGILSKSEACIHIKIDDRRRIISVYDNGSGISKDNFQATLLNIADSDKDRNEDKGFRGIGRLGGLAYCNKLVFTSSVKGEIVKSIMEWDAKELRNILHDRAQRPSASELIEKITCFKEDKCDVNEHFFEVMLIDILQENNELLEEKDVCNYLEFAAPVPYKNSFIFRNKIYDYAKENGFKIDEYKILVNDEQLFKPYKADLFKGVEGNKEKYDSIFDLDFKQIVSHEGQVLAWMWYGVSGFKIQIPAINQIRGLRLRKENIQIGNSETISRPSFFKESRGNYYFVGEIFAINPNLIPNARRDYFNLNPTCRAFEKGIKPILYTEFSKIYHYASDVKTALNKTVKYSEAQQEFAKKKATGNFISEIDKNTAQQELKKYELDAEKAQKILDSCRRKAEENPVYERIYKILNSEMQVEEECEIDTIPPSTKGSKQYITQILSKLDKKEKKLVSRIYSVIQIILPKETADTVISKIQEELSK